MSKRNPKLYLDDIIIAIESIQEYTKGFSLVSFEKDKKTIDAVVRNLEIIGEAANNIPSELKIKYPNLPWKDMISMRNKVLHEYFGVDVDILWQTINEDLLPLKEKLKNLSEYQTLNG